MSRRFAPALPSPRHGRTGSRRLTPGSVAEPAAALAGAIAEAVVAGTAGVALHLPAGRPVLLAGELVVVEEWHGLHCEYFLG